jgi:MYXO-CTERM domain-containing protein
MKASFAPVVGLATFGVLVAISPVARAETVSLSGSCSYETDFGCSAQCEPGSINCSVQFADSCSADCTAEATTSCTTACETECTENPGSFSCSEYCGGQCESECSSNGGYGASSETDCVTDCQGECSYQCNLSPPTSTCSTECGTSCKATENVECGVKCQVKDSASCSITPASCMAACTGTGGVIVCNGQVVYIASSVTDAASWYVDHLDSQFSLNVKASCTGDQCSASLGVGGCDVTSGSTPSGAGLFFVGVGLVLVAARRRTSS